MEESSEKNRTFQKKANVKLLKNWKAGFCKGVQPLPLTYIHFETSVRFPLPTNWENGLQYFTLRRSSKIDPPANWSSAVVLDRNRCSILPYVIDWFWPHLDWYVVTFLYWGWKMSGWRKKRTQWTNLSSPPTSTAVLYCQKSYWIFDNSTHVNLPLETPFTTD